MKNKPNLFTIVFIAAVFSISACSQLHDLQQSLNGGNSNDNKCNTSTTDASVSYATPFIDADSHKVVMYNAETEAYTLTVIPGDFAVMYSSQILKLADGSILFRAQITGDIDKLFRFYADGTLSTIDPIALYPFEATVTLTTFGGVFFNQVSASALAIPYLIDYADGSKETRLVEYNLNTTNLRDISILLRTEAPVVCPDIFTSEEKEQIATLQMLSDDASTVYEACNKTDTCTNGECQAAADAKSALCTFRDAIYQKYECPKAVLCQNMQCALGMFK